MLGLRAAVVVVGGLLASSPLAEAVVGALVVDLAVARAGVLWVTDGPSPRLLRRRVAGAVTLALAVTLGAAVIGRALGLAQVRPGRLDLVFLLSLLGLAATAIRDELLLRALPFHFGRRAGLGRAPLYAFCGLASGATVFADGTPEAIALALGSGVLFSAIYDRLGGAWPALAAHTAWSVALGPLLRGGLIDYVPERGELSEAGTASGPIVPILTGLAVVAAFTLVPRLAVALPSSPVPAPTGEE